MEATLPIAASSNPESKKNQTLAELARAIGHPHRIAIIRFLSAANGCFVGNLVEHLPIAQSTVSQHLKILKEAGWIRGTIDGPRVCYCLEPQALEQFKLLLQTIAVNNCC